VGGDNHGWPVQWSRWAKGRKGVTLSALARITPLKKLPRPKRRRGKEEEMIDLKKCLVTAWLGFMGLMVLVIALS